MEVFSSVDLEAWLICLVGDAISYSCTKHHDRALHIIIHDILKIRFKSLLVNHEEVYFLIRDNLDSDVTSDEVNLPSHVIKLFVLSPQSCLFVNFEEKNRAGRSDNQSLLEKKVHVA